MIDSVTMESFACFEDSFKPPRISTEEALLRLDVIDGLHDLPSASAYIDEIIMGRQLTPFQRRSAYEHLDKYCRDSFETECGSFDLIEVPDDLVVILQNDIEKLGDPDILAWAADLYVHIPDRFDDVIEELDIDRIDLLEKLSSVIPQMELALLFIADRQGFREQDVIFGSAMAGKLRSSQQIIGDDYKKVHKMLSLQHYAKQLAEIQIDIRLIPEEQPDERGDEEDIGDPGLSMASLIVNLAIKSNATFWMSDDETPYITYPKDKHLESYPLNSRQVRHWLGFQIHKTAKKTPKSATFQDAVSQMEGIARYEGPTHKVFTRLAKHADKIYLDLCNDKWEVVEVGPDGWHVIPGYEVPVKFRRAKGMKALPVPTQGGNLNDLRPILNLPDDDTWLLVKCWLAMAFNPRGPYPLLIVYGEPGSAKSTFCKILRHIVDPNVTLARRPPANERDLMIAATNSWLSVYENLSGLSTRMADALCVLATGGGLSQRELYTNQDETLLDVMRPIILNGIDSITTRSDLLDRAIVITLQEIKDEARKTETDVYAELDKILPGILGAILDVIADGLKKLPDTKLDHMPRMADFALWSKACEGALGCQPGEFMRVYEASRSGAQIDLIAVVTVSSVIWLSSWRRSQRSRELYRIC